MKTGILTIAMLVALAVAAPAHAAVCWVTVSGIPKIDTDCDGIPDINDNCDKALNCDQADWDNNGIGDACQDHIDQDDLPDTTYNQDPAINHADHCVPYDIIIDYDNCPLDNNGDQADTDDDGIGDACDDSDNDGIIDLEDTCPDIYDTEQPDYDDDGVGDVCDNCILFDNPGQEDDDEDGIGDVCGPDIDNDTIVNIHDNCVYIPNTDQLDIDGDGIGDVCDNCPDVDNPDQTDTDEDGFGDVCQPEPEPALDPAPEPAESPQQDTDWIISGSGGAKNNCTLTPHAAASVEGMLGFLFMASGLVGLAIRRKR